VLGKLSVRRDSDEIVPSALDGTVPACVFGSALDQIAERCHSFRGVYFLICKWQSIQFPLFLSDSTTITPYCIAPLFANDRRSRYVLMPYYALAVHIDICKS
jgi:hypothetical protein